MFGFWKSKPLVTIAREEAHRRAKAGEILLEDVEKAVFFDCPAQHILAAQQVFVLIFGFFLVHLGDHLACIKFIVALGALAEKV